MNACVWGGDLVVAMMALDRGLTGPCIYCFTNRLTFPGRRRAPADPTEACCSGRRKASAPVLQAKTGSRTMLQPGPRRIRNACAAGGKTSEAPPRHGRL